MIDRIFVKNILALIIIRKDGSMQINNNFRLLWNFVAVGKFYVHTTGLSEIRELM